MKNRSLAPAITSFFRGPLNNATASNCIEAAEEKLIEQVCDGDIEAFSILVRRYEDFVFTLARGMVCSDDEAADISQEVFLRAYHYLRRFERRSSFKTWLYRIAYNVSVSHLSKRREAVESSSESEPEPISVTGGSVALTLTLEKLISMLKPDLRAVVIFHYYQDLKYEEIAEILGCPVGTVKVRLYRAKADLKKLWEKYAI